MRSLLILLALLASPAVAGTHAVYAGQDGKRLEVEVDDAGDARIGEAGAADYGLLRGGHFFVVGMQDGRPTVARIEDVAAAIDRVVPAIFRDLFSGAPARPTGLRIEKLGETVIAGQSGTRYAVRGLDDTKPDVAETYVMSADAKLKPIGAALEGFMNAAVLPAAALLGSAAAELVSETRAIFALGTPLQAGTRMTLETVEPAQVPASRLALPATPMTVDALVAAMQAARPE